MAPRRAHAARRRCAGGAMIGNRLLQLARAWFDETTVSRVFEPLIADLQRECTEASGLQRRLCHIRGVIYFAISFAVAMPKQVQRRLPAHAVLGGWIALEAFAAIGVVAQLYLFLWDFEPLNRSQL